MVKRVFECKQFHDEEKGKLVALKFIKYA